MDCCASMIKILLGILNFIFLLFGLSLFVIGCIAAVGDHAIKTGFQAGMRAAESLSRTNVTSNPYVEEAHQGLTELLSKGAAPLIIIGIIISVIAISGLFGVCCNSRGLLVTYMVSLFILLTAQLVFIGTYMSGVLDKRMKQWLLQSLQDEYISLDSKSPPNMAWNLIMLEFHCCGVNDYKDFNSAKQWQRDKPYNGTNTTLITPLMCCKNKTFEMNTTQAPSIECAVKPKMDNSNYKHGCYKAFKERMGKYVILYSFALLLLQLFLIALVAYLIHETDKAAKPGDGNADC